MANETDITYNYALKLYMPSGLVLSVGPYVHGENAKATASDIAEGRISTVESQRGNLIRLTTKPEAIEIVPFVPGKGKGDAR